MKATPSLNEFLGRQFIDQLAEVESREGPLACGICFLELYPPFALVLIRCVEIAWLSLFYSASHSNSVTIALALGAEFVALAHAGVVRRWRPALRLAGYAAVVGVAAGLIAAFGD